MFCTTYIINIIIIIIISSSSSSSSSNSSIQNVIVEWKALLLRLREDPASRLGLDVEYPDRFSRSFSAPALKGWD